MSNFNGAKNHNVEDILASIRSTISDEPDDRLGPAGFSASTARGPSVPLQGNPNRRDLSIAEEAAEFELPAIFKPGHQATPPKPNIFERLTDVLKPQAESDTSRQRTVVRFEPAASASLNRRHDAAREDDSPRMPAAPQTSVNQIEKQNDEVKRVMPTFFDTRMKCMSETASKPTPVEPPPQQVQQAQPYVPAPPRLPELNILPPQTGPGGEIIEDTAAQLLRPILKQWLTDNMPKIVERALRSEADGSGQPHQPEGPHDYRKTLR